MPEVLSVSSLTALIKRRLEGDFKTVDLEAEISGWKVYPSGHVYFTLKDEGAQISAVMFSNAFKAELGSDPTLADAVARGQMEGRKVKVRGGLSVYPPRGNYQFVVRRMKLAGLGELMRRYLELKAKLEAEGLFDRARKRPLPFLPRHIGIVTSEAGAVIHDMTRVFVRRFPNVELRLFPAQVQGDAAPASLIAGLDYFNSTPWADLVIVGRGGGSFEDLFCFNDEAFVRAVAASAVPVISAVGHESDFTLCDFAADVRAGTPSIAAELAVPVKDELVRRLLQLNQRLGAALRGKGEWFAQRLDQLSDALVNALEGQYRELSHRVDAAAVALKHLSPYAVLERGYSLVTDAQGAVVRSAAAVNDGEDLEVRFAEGSARVRVEERKSCSK